MQENKEYKASDFPDAVSMSLQKSKYKNQAQASGLKNTAASQLVKDFQQKNLKLQKAQKYQYYDKLKQGNQQMLQKIKQINQALDEQVKHIENKMISKVIIPKNKRQRVQSQRNIPVERKYKQLDHIKKELQMRRMQKRSMASLEQRLESLKAQYKIKQEEMKKSLHTLQKLKRLDPQSGKTDQSHTKQSERTKKSQIQNPIHSEIKKLKHQIKIETDRIYMAKESFIKNNRRKSNYALQLNQNPTKWIKNQHGNSLSNRSIKHQEEQEYLSEEAKKLKHQYQMIGKRLQLLKIQKLTLSMKDDCSQKKKYLQHLKSKIVELKKLTQ